LLVSPVVTRQDQTYSCLQQVLLSILHALLFDAENLFAGSKRLDRREVPFAAWVTLLIHKCTGVATLVLKCPNFI